MAIVVGVAYSSDIDHVRQLLRDAAASVEFVVSDPAMRGSCINGMYTAVYKALGRANIEIPFPQRAVTMAGAPAEPTPPG